MIPTRKQIESSIEGNTGRWIRDGHHITCDQCGSTMCDTDREGDAIPKNYCPNCGKKMEIYEKYFWEKEAD